LAKAAGASVVGVGALIEKEFEGGRALLASLGIPIESLTVITDMANGRIVFAP
jgi:xanthine phosphoribosyltransferase